MNKIVLIDGNSIANRAFYALPPLTNTAGMQTNAVYGFTTMLLRLLEEEQPTHFLVAFDAGKATFRHQEYKEYKGHRMKTPPELSEQFPLLRELLDGLSIARFELEGYEADDIIGTISRLADKERWQVLVVTGDKDMLQLASEQVTIALTRKGISEMERYGPNEIQEKYGLSPQQIIDLKGLMGDASDNIPGIPGVGEKTALKLLHEYGTVEEVLARTDDLKGKLKERVVEHAEDARMSKELATIFRDVPMALKLEDMSYGGYEPGAARELFRKLEFKSLLDRLGESGEDTGSVMEEEALQIVRLDVDGTEQLQGDLAQVQAIHVEIIGENPHEAEVIGFALDTGEAVYTAAFDWLKQSEEAAPLREWLADGSKLKYIYDSHKAIVALHWHGLVLEGITVDVLLAGYLLDPTQGDDTLSGLTMRYGTGRLAADEEVFGKGAKFKVPDAGTTSGHLARKARAVLKLAPVLMDKLEADGMRSLLEDVEMPLTLTLSRMETTGFKVDKAGLVAYGEELSAQLETIIQNIYAQAGEEFNLNSPKQLGEILFDKLGLPVVKKTKTGYSTDAEVLDKLAPHHEIVSQIVHYRQLAKLQSTYIEGLVKEIREKTGKIHTYYRQTIAATGRLSSQFPNLQNIPIRMEEGRLIRKVFVPSEPGWQVLAADYSQIELRVLAHISGDPRLKEAFIADMDIHTKTAMDVFGVTADEVDANMRRQAKAVNFGIVYGISDYGLSQNLNITRKEAAQFIEQYFAVFEGVKQFMTDIVAQAREDGYVSTLLHRRRYLPEINASNYNQRSFAERTAMNTPIQGTAADIIKLAMIQMEDKLREEGLRSRMLLQVHDELVFEVPEEELDTMKQLVPQVMEQAMQLAVPLKAEVSFGANWYEAK